jgi:molecular chaperone DnaK
VPAWYGDLPRAAVVDAARIAGLARIHMINEPTAAALAFGLGPEAGGARKVVVYDLGGGTFDVTVAEVARGTVRVLATAGEPRLGGKDWDDELLNLVAEEVLEKTGADPREDPLANHELRERVVAAKHELSSVERVIVRAPIAARTHAVEVERERFEARTKPLLLQTETQLGLALEKARLTWDEVGAVLLVGGATRMPAVPALVRSITGREPLVLTRPEEAVARGAALYSALLSRGSHVDEDSGAATAPPPSRSRPRDVAKDIALPEDTESVELPLLPGKCRVPEVRDVVAQALGVLVLGRSGGRNVVLIPEQTPVPARRSRTFRTIRRDQTAVCVRVLEGADSDPDGCAVIGTLVVDGLPPGRPAGQKVEVSYEVDEDGRIQVHARDEATGKAARAVIERRGALADEEIARLVREYTERVR